LRAHGGSRALFHLHFRRAGSSDQDFSVHILYYPVFHDPY
jgi:hypothetical protein